MTAPATMAAATVHARLTRDVIVVTRLIESVSAPDCGAVASFIGAVREDGDGVLKLEYEAYEPMAARELERIAREVAVRRGLHAIAVEHRLGLLAVGEVAVAVVTASPHRRQALTACAEAIDMIKRDVPIWKREHHACGSRWVDCASP